MDTLAYLQSASSTVRPYVPIMQFTSSGIPTFSWIWRSTPTSLKVIALITVIVIIILVGVKINKEVQRAKELFFTHPKHRKQMISTDYITTHVDQLLSQSKRLAESSHKQMEQGHDDAAISLASASAAFLQSAYAIMPKKTLEQMPHYEDILQDINRLLHLNYASKLPLIPND